MVQASEACECHACTPLQWPPAPPLPLPPPSQQPLIHPHLYGSPGVPRTINLELESLDTLQQQAYLATLGDWDDPHYKFGTPAHPRHPGSESPQLVAPATKPSSGPPPAPRASPPPVSTHRHSQQGNYCQARGPGVGVRLELTAAVQSEQRLICLPNVWRPKRELGIISGCLGPN